MLSAGIRLAVNFLLNLSHSIGSFGMLVDMAKRSQRTEEAFALVKISSTYDDQVRIPCHSTLPPVSSRLIYWIC